MTQTPSCEACGSTYLAWQLRPTCLLWRCPRCGHVRRDLELAAADHRGPSYGGDPSADRLRLALTYRRIRSRLHLEAPQDVLEVGAGHGALLRRFRSDGFRVQGIDPAARDDDSLVDRRSIEELGLPEGSVDLVVAVHVLEHVTDLPEVLTRLARVLRPGGILYALTPNASSGGLRLFGSSWWMLEDPTHRQFMSPASARRLLSRAGFGRVRTRPVLLDSLGVEGSSLARAWSAPPDAGVLSTRSGRVAAAAVVPLGLTARALRPSFSPTLEIVARRPQVEP